MREFFSALVVRNGQIFHDTSNGHIQIIDQMNADRQLAGKEHLNNDGDKQDFWEFDLYPGEDGFRSTPELLLTRSGSPLQQDVPANVLRSYERLRSQLIAWEAGERLGEIPFEWKDVLVYLHQKKVCGLPYVLYGGEYDVLPSNILILAGNTKVKYISGSLQLKHISGSLQVEIISSSVQVETISGSVQVKILFGSLQVETLSGSVQAEKIFGSLQVKYLSGSVQVGKISGSLQAEHISGSVKILEDKRSTNIT